MTLERPRVRADAEWRPRPTLTGRNASATIDLWDLFNQRWRRALGRPTID